MRSPAFVQDFLLEFLRIVNDIVKPLDKAQLPCSCGFPKSWLQQSLGDVIAMLIEQRDRPR